MKKVSFTFSLSIACLFLLSGCSKKNECHVCTLENFDPSEVCRADYPDNSSYQLTLDALEDSGYNCTKK